MAKRLYIGNISNRATEESIRELFAASGEVVSINLITDARTGKPKGMAFLVMAMDEDALQAIETLNGTVLHGRQLSVSEANTQEPRERRDLDRKSGRGKGK
jgi:cold-inducible RNA-binding protein